MRRSAYSIILQVYSTFFVALLPLDISQLFVQTPKGRNLKAAGDPRNGPKVGIFSLLYLHVKKDQFLAIYVSVFISVFISKFHQFTLYLSRSFQSQQVSSRMLDEVKGDEEGEKPAPPAPPPPAEGSWLRYLFI